MLKAFFNKEMIKTRWFLTIAALVLVVMSIYVPVNINHLFALKGAKHIWNAAITNDAIFMQILQYVPLVIGVSFALVQYIPEVLQKRIKLTLHLPCSYVVSIGAMLLFGQVVLLSLFVASGAIVVLGSWDFFPAEINTRFALIMTEWSLAGLQSYVLMAWICLEPSWQRQVFNFFVSLAVMKIYFMSNAPQAYTNLLIVMGISTLLCNALPFLSVRRFVEGKEDMI